MFVDEDCVDSRSDVDDLRTRDCLYGESGQVRYGGCCSLTLHGCHLRAASTPNVRLSTVRYYATWTH